MPSSFGFVKNGASGKSIVGKVITGIFMSGTYGSSLGFVGTGKDGPVMSGKPLSNTFGNKPFTSVSTWFIIFALNCSEVTYLYVKKPPPRIPKTRIVVTMVIISKAFLMVKEQIARATALMSVVVLLLIVALSHLYVTMSLMTRQIQEKIK